MQTTPKSTIHCWKVPNNADVRDAALTAFFPDAQQRSNQLAPFFRGGRIEALKKLSEVDAIAYGNTRNQLNGQVTHLSPYFRHGCLTIKEAVTQVREQFGSHGEKLLFEFAWREYWRHVWYANGMAILQDMQSPSVRLEFKPLCKAIQRGDTGLPCMDDFISSLQTQGYLHNHARMWLAAYIVHWLKNDWQLAADWMHDLLIDGDYASNHLSWQWVASTFSHKPYFFNQENLAKYTNQQYCNRCEAPCPFKDSYANLDQKLFQASQQTARQLKPFVSIKQQAFIVGNQTVIWVHDEMLNATHPLMKRPEEKVFIFDPHYYKNWSMLRLQFMADCLAEMPDVSVWVGDTQTVLKQLNVQKILTQATPNDHLQQQVLGFSTSWDEEEMVCEKTIKPDDLNSFSKFWKKASKSFIGK